MVELVMSTLPRGLGRPRARAGRSSGSWACRRGRATAAGTYWPPRGSSGFAPDSLLRRPPGAGEPARGQDRLRRPPCQPRQRPRRAEWVGRLRRRRPCFPVGAGRYTLPMTSAQRSGLDAPERSSLPGPPAKGLRRDAQRNRDAIVAAAREVFSEQGLEAPLEEIARRAGVGIGTLYRRFPTRVDLVDAVLAGRLRAHVDAAEQALRIGDPWDGFAFYLERTCQLEASDRGVGDVMSMRFPRATAVETAKARLFELVRELVRRAQASGQLRADLTLEDLAFLNWSNAKIVEATGAVAPDAWRRHLAFLLDAFRADRARELPEPSLTPRQVYRAMLSLGVRCGRSAQ